MIYNIGYLSGLLVSLFIGAVLVCGILIMTTKNHSLKREYDERQEFIKGKGVKYGFFTMLTASLGIVYLNNLLPKPIMDTTFAMTLVVSLGVLVNVHYCIWRDGYFSLNEKPGLFIVIFALLTATQYFIFAMNLKFRIVSDGMITYRGANLAVGVMSTFLLIDLLAKSICQKKEERED